MISEIKLENFRSIRKAEVTLSPLTIIIGANGSGKSNLVKALEFLASIPSSGLSLAVSRQGGRDGLMPKCIPAKEIGTHQVSFEYTKRLPSPTGKDESAPRHIDVHHSFGFSFRSNSRVSINFESLKFDSVLYIGEILGRSKSTKSESDFPSNSGLASSFTISHQGSASSYTASPSISEENLTHYLNWLGLSRFKSTLKTAKELEKFLTYTLKFSGKDRSLATISGPRANRGLYIDRGVATICDDARQFRAFLDYMEETRRYDLLLNELRKEQAPSDSPYLSKFGENLPAALRKLSSDKVAYARLKSTFETIAPHIIGFSSKQLRTGKEFVEFEETGNGRGIESWETSDGSLRALAILVAIETAQIGETIIVEEPEQNLHPWAVRALLDHIREVISENSIQVILTTHSEHVLERAFPEEVLVASRTPEEGTVYKRIRDIVTKGPIEMGEVGRLWVKGVLGGVPSAAF